MDLSVIVGVVLGLAVAYWIIATACAFIVEAFASFANVRGKALSRFVVQMLGAEVRRPLDIDIGKWFTNWGEELRAFFRVNRPAHRRDRIQEIVANPASAGAHVAMRMMTHPIIESLDKPKLGMRGADTDASYIPAEQFARALFDVLVTMPTPELLVTSIDDSGLPQELKDALQAAIKPLAGDSRQADAEALLQALRKAAAGSIARADKTKLESLAPLGIDPHLATRIGGAPAPLRVGALAEHVVGLLTQRNAASMTYGDLRKALSNNMIPRALRAVIAPLITGASHDLDEARKAIERWFDGTMERASGWYKRYTMVWLFITGFVVAGLFDLDSIKLGEGLVSSAEHRAAAERLARRINEDPGEVRAWVQRTLTTRGLAKGGILNGSTVIAADPFADEKSRVKLMWELQATAAAFGDGRFAAPTVLAVKADFDQDRQLETWEEISVQIDLIRGCDAAARTNDCALTSFQRAIEAAKQSAQASPAPVDTGASQAPRDSDFAAEYWKDSALIAAADLPVAMGMHRLLRDRKIEDAEALRVALQKPEIPFPWFVSNKSDWPAVHLESDAPWFGLGAFLATFFHGWVGKLITALMVAMGAPFWYELVGKIINMRGTGSKPA